MKALIRNAIASFLTFTIAAQISLASAAPPSKPMRTGRLECWDKCMDAELHSCKGCATKCRIPRKLCP
jgi:hypothetical protein